MSEGKKSRLFIYGILEPKDHDLDEVCVSTETVLVGFNWKYRNGSNYSATLILAPLGQLKSDFGPKSTKSHRI